MRPESRRTELLTQAVGDELVIYDTQSHEAHRLSPTAAIVWRTADGQRSLADLSAAVRESVATSPVGATAIGEEEGDAVVRLALAELDRVGLLLRALPPLGEPLSRREMIGVTAALVPVIASIVAPTPAMAQTIPIAPVGHPANGTYDGNGSVVGANPCKFGNGPVRVVLSLIGGFGTLRVTHIPVNQTFTFSNAAVSSQPSPQTYVVTASGTGAGFVITNQIAFTVFPDRAELSGAQTFQGECGTFQYGLSGVRTSLSTT